MSSGPASSRSSETSFAGALRTRVSARWLVTTVRHNAPRPAELRHPRTLLTSGVLHARLRHRGFTMLSSQHGRTLYTLAEDLDRRGIDGSIVDCGVWNGGSTALLAAATKDRALFAFDSFQGLPEPSEQDGSDSAGWEGTYVGAAEKVRAAVARVGAAERLTVVPGWFDDTLRRYSQQIGDIALLHVDADWYSSCKTVLDVLGPQVRPGGYIVMDDYVSWAGAVTAADEYRRARQVHAPLIARHYWRV